MLVFVEEGKPENPENTPRCDERRATSDEWGLVERKGRSRARPPAPSHFSLPDLARRALAFSIVPTDREPGTNKLSPHMAPGRNRIGVIG